MSAPDALEHAAALAARPARSPGVQLYPLGDEAVVYLPVTGSAYTLNHSALAILELCDGHRTVAEIGQACAEALGCDADALLADVSQGVSELFQAGLLC